MSIEDTIGSQDDTPACVLCGKNVQGERGFARINHDGIMVNLCCPHCLESFEKDPGPHMARLAKAGSYRALKDLKNRKVHFG
jgi:ribosome-binding protein aMBF1 (putative translation factor)